MKPTGHQLKVYLALILLIVLVAVFPYKEGFANDTWPTMFYVASWFRTDKKKDDETKDVIKDVIKDKYDDKYGSGLLGSSYTTTTILNDVSYKDYYNKPQFN